MRDRHGRRGLVFVACMLAAVMCAGSAAFACTVWIGRLQVAGSGTNGTTSVADGANNGSFGMVYCGNAQPTPANVDVTQVPNAPPNAVAPITVQVFQRPCTLSNGGTASSSGTWPSGIYTVNYLPNGAYDCMNPRGIPLRTMQVGPPDPTTKAQSSPTTVDVPVAGNDGGGIGDYAPGPSDKAAICVAMANSAYSNQAPIMFV